MFDDRSVGRAGALGEAGENGGLRIDHEKRDAAVVLRRSESASGRGKSSVAQPDDLRPAERRSEYVLDGQRAAVAAHGDPEHPGSPIFLNLAHDAIAGRIATMAQRVGARGDVVLVGGLARNEGFVASLARGLGTEIRLAEDPEYVGALGAALHAWEGR